MKMTERKVNRRTALAAGLATLAAGSASYEALAAPKAPGETRVLFLVGDYWHNGVAQETHWRRVLESTGWRLLFAQSSQFVTKESLGFADLFVVARYAGPDSLGFTGQRVVEKRPEGAPWMTDEQEAAIVENVTGRGMGLLHMHCSTWNPEKKKYMELMGIVKPIMHGPVQVVKLHDLNQDHPVTKGLGDFTIGLDENFGVELDPAKTTVLYKSTGEQDKRTDIASWCSDAGKGRVVGIHFGHEPQAFQPMESKTVMWRAAHWAMRRDIPPSDFKTGY
jgi:type 1 glutamine amidotransferase